MKFVVYEVWTKARVIEAKDFTDAYDVGQPSTDPTEMGLSLCNWHVCACDGSKESHEPEPITGALNYQQLSTEEDIH